MGSPVIDGRTIHHLAPGGPDGRTGQRVVYVHGTGCNARVWAPHMTARQGPGLGPLRRRGALDGGAVALMTALQTGGG